MSEEPNIGWTEALGEHASNPATPRTSGDVFFALGKQWTLSSCENRIKAQFEQWVRVNAKRALGLMEREFSPEEASLMRSTYIADLASGHYNWDGRHVRSARGDMPGLIYLTFLLLRRCHPEVTEDQIRAMFLEDAKNVGMALAWALGNSEAAGKPNSGNPPVNGERSDIEQQKKKLKEEWDRLNAIETPIQIVKTPTPTLDAP